MFESLTETNLSLAFLGGEMCWRQSKRGLHSCRIRTLSQASFKDSAKATTQLSLHNSNPDLLEQQQQPARLTEKQLLPKPLEPTTTTTQNQINTCNQTQQQPKPPKTRQQRPDNSPNLLTTPQRGFPYGSWFTVAVSESTLAIEETYSLFSIPPRRL